MNGDHRKKQAGVVKGDGEGVPQGPWRLFCLCGSKRINCNEGVKKGDGKTKNARAWRTRKLLSLRVSKRILLRDRRSFERYNNKILVKDYREGTNDGGAERARELLPPRLPPITARARELVGFLPLALCSLAFSMLSNLLFIYADVY